MAAGPQGIRARHASWIAREGAGGLWGFRRGPTGNDGGLLYNDLKSVSMTEGCPISRWRLWQGVCTSALPECQQCPTLCRNTFEDIISQLF